MLECKDMTEKTGVGTLYTVATPIGNLDDISHRAVETLRQVAVVACEDTREAGKLLAHLGISGPRLVSYHAQSGHGREAEILVLLQAGTDVALISDRGTPGISDPGVRLVSQAVAVGIRVVPVPGPVAFVTALQAAGVDTSAFLYLGFLPHKKGRQTLLQRIRDEQMTVVLYESPHRILRLLEALADCPKRLVIGRELTKVHEEFLRGTAAEILADLQARPAVRGEFVVIVQAD
jgi:16S rRNA (cytidine1402-2'-O)-methyltransferase